MQVVWVDSIRIYQQADSMCIRFELMTEVFIEGKEAPEDLMEYRPV
jgi:hypothetical protein